MLILASAAIHVVWNLAAKSADGNLHFLWLLSAGGAIAGVAVTNTSLLSTSVLAAWPWIVTSACIHYLYFTTLGAAYGRGSLSWTYPVARGLGVALAAPAALVVFHEQLRALQWIGLAAVVAGVVLMRNEGGEVTQPASAASPKHGALLLACLVGITVAAYSLVDSHGVKVIAPLPYISLSFLGSTVLMTPQALRSPACTKPWTALGCGVLSLLSYVLMLYAYRVAQVGAVLAVRQTAMVMAVLVGWLIVKERPSMRGWSGSALVLIGAVALVVG